MRRLGVTLLSAGLTCVLSGCRHKTHLAPLPQILAPVELADVPRPENQPMIEPPEVKLPPMPIAAAGAHPRRERKRPKIVAAVPVPAAPAESEPQQEVSAIGSLSTGGDSSPRSQQEAAEMIAAIEKRLNGLPSQTAEAQKTQISKIKNFQKQAQDALTSGDIEGAKTLATKAKLLLDDLEQQ
ncbi:hypothetical protein [Edaphobacter bradus]|uniref:hypothetical protein n=1 Tax=Edaphobacter bradus TaxID=2259016 RepID=UPI0021DFE9C3|nr:hypothetical protein [Edaphobacter bradus]